MTAPIDFDALEVLTAQLKELHAGVDRWFIDPPARMTTRDRVDTVRLLLLGCSLAERASHLLGDAVVARMKAEIDTARLQRLVFMPVDSDAMH